MRWKVDFTDGARREFLRLDEPFRSRVAQKLEHLEESPFPPGSVKLHDYEGLYRMKAGPYRVVYRVLSRTHSILITRVRHRKDVYRGL